MLDAVVGRRAATTAQYAREREASGAENTLRFIADDGSEYILELNANGEASIVSCSTDAVDLKIPAQFDGWPIVALAEDAFAAYQPKIRLSSPSSLDANVLQPLAGIGLQRAARNAHLRRVFVPEGVSLIARGAFRGCKALETIVLPQSLCEISDFAFSQTGLTSIELPASCTSIGARALWTGPEALPGVRSAYRSRIRSIRVDERNTRYCVMGGALCRRDSDGLRVVLIPGEADAVTVVDEALEIDSDAMRGVDRIGVLSVPNGIALAGEDGLLPEGACEKLVIRFPETDVSLDFGDTALMRATLARTQGMTILEGERVVEAYDKALDAEKSGFEAALLMATRLSAPDLLDPKLQRSFRAKLDSTLESLCSHIGARARWDDFELLADAGLLDEAGIARAIDALGALGDSAGVTYLLGMKNARFGKAAWNYDL